jgi:parvulin-like peptidyl-prolyl isomerase
MMANKGVIRKYNIFLLLAFLALSVSACAGDTPTPTAAVSELPLETPPLPTFTSTPFPPTATPEPLAAVVNGEEITLAQFKAEFERYQSVVGTQLATEESEQIVLDDLINQILLAQAAAEAGFVVDEALIQERFDSLVAQLGNRQSLLDWITANGYSEQSFREDLARAIAAAWMRDQILGEIPDKIEQVHALQILLYNSEEANDVYAQLNSGADFEVLASEYDPVGKGDIGWFPRGYLTESKLEEMAFNLQPGEYSDVIETDTGFHIIMVLERDPAWPLEPDARLALQAQALRRWLIIQRDQSDIRVLLP